MKIDLHKISGQIIAVGTPIVLAALAHKLATGKFDVKAIARYAVAAALVDRAA